MATAGGATGALRGRRPAGASAGLPLFVNLHGLPSRASSGMADDKKPPAKRLGGLNSGPGAARLGGLLELSGRHACSRGQPEGRRQRP